mgnify:CR=1 FL=1
MRDRVFGVYTRFDGVPAFMEIALRPGKRLARSDAYLGADEIDAKVKETIAEMGSPTIKDMGAVMKNVMAKFAATGARVDGKQVNEAVRKALG